MSEEKKDESLFDVTLLKPHTHKNKKYTEGAKIKVTAGEKAWLIQNDVIKGGAK